MSTGAGKERTSETSSHDARSKEGAAAPSPSPEVQRALELARAVRKRRVTVARRAERIRGDLARVEDIPRLQRIGRLLIAQADRVPRGARVAVLDDWEEGGTVEVELDPARPARPQAEGFFERARRFRRGESIMRARLADAEAEVARLAGVEAELAAFAPDPALPGALAALVGRARAAGVKEPDATLPGRRARELERVPFNVFHGVTGAAILVGRGAADNDALTTRHARPHDLWLHAKGMRGAHVVVRLARGQVALPELLVDAATLAAHFSDARGELVCEVSYAPRRYVRKPRKSPPGLVVVDREKVVKVRLEPERLARLLATKERD